MSVKRAGPPPKQAWDVGANMVNDTPAQVQMETLSIAVEKVNNSFGFTLGSNTDGGHVIVRVKTGAPSKILPNDEIVSINGQSVLHLSHMEVHRLIATSNRLMMSVRRVKNASPTKGRISESGPAIKKIHRGSSDMSTPTVIPGQLGDDLAHGNGDANEGDLISPTRRTAPPPSTSIGSPRSQKKSLPAPGGRPGARPLTATDKARNEAAARIVAQRQKRMEDDRLKQAAQNNKGASPRKSLPTPVNGPVGKRTSTTAAPKVAPISEKPSSPTKTYVPSVPVEVVEEKPVLALDNEVSYEPEHVRPLAASPSRAPIEEPVLSLERSSPERPLNGTSTVDFEDEEDEPPLPDAPPPVLGSPPKEFAPAPPPPLSEKFSSELIVLPPRRPSPPLRSSNLDSTDESEDEQFSSAPSKVLTVNMSFDEEPAPIPVASPPRASPSKESKPISPEPPKPVPPPPTSDQDGLHHTTSMAVDEDPAHEEEHVKPEEPAKFSEDEPSPIQILSFNKKRWPYSNVEELPGYKVRGTPLSFSIRTNGERLGIRLIGGSDSMLGAIFVESVDANSPAAKGGLLPGDKVLSINGASLDRVKHNEGLSLFRIPSGGVFNIQALRLDASMWDAVFQDSKSLEDQLSYVLSVKATLDSKHPAFMKKTLYDIPTQGPIRTFSMNGGSSFAEFGFSVVGGCDTMYGGVFVTNVISRTPASAAGLSVGSRVLAINGVGLIAASMDAQISAFETSFKAEPRVLNLTVMEVPRPTWTRIAALVGAHGGCSLVCATYVRNIMLKCNETGTVITDGPVNVVQLSRTFDQKLGLHIAGGFNTELGGIFITYIQAGACANNPNFQVGYRILEVDHNTLITSSQEAAVTTIRKTGTKSLFVIQEVPSALWKQVYDSSNWPSYSLCTAGGRLVSGSVKKLTVRKTNGQVGFAIGDHYHFGGIFVEDIDDRGPAVSTNLRIGDRILTIGKVGVMSYTTRQVTELIQEFRDGEVIPMEVVDIGPQQWAIISQSSPYGISNKSASRTSMFDPVFTVPRLHAIRPLRFRLAPECDETTGPIHVVFSTLSDFRGIGLTSRPGSIGGAFISSNKTHERELKEGDLVLEIDDFSVLYSSVDEIYRRLDHDGDEPIRIVVQRLESNQWHALLEGWKSKRYRISPPNFATRPIPALGFTIQKAAVNDGANGQPVIMNDILKSHLSQYSEPLKNGDQLKSIEADNFEFMPLDKIVETLEQYARQESFTMIIRREGMPHSVKWTRAFVERGAVDHKENGIFHFNILGQSLASLKKNVESADEVVGAYICELHDKPENVDLHVGDRLLAINGIDVSSYGFEDIIAAFANTLDSVYLNVVFDPSGYKAIQGKPLVIRSSTVPERAGAIPVEAVRHVSVKRLKNTFGFQVVGPTTPGQGSKGIFVSMVDTSHPTYATSLREGDQIIAVDGRDVQDASLPSFMTVMKAAKDEVVLDVATNKRGYAEQLRHTSESIDDLSQLSNSKFVTLKLAPDEKLGIKLKGVGAGVTEGGIYIDRIEPGSSAAKSQQLNVGDRVLSINNVDTRVTSRDKILGVLKSISNEAVIEIVSDLEGYSSLEHDPALQSAPVYQSQTPLSPVTRSSRDAIAVVPYPGTSDVFPSIPTVVNWSAPSPDYVPVSYVSQKVLSNPSSDPKDPASIQFNKNQTVNRISAGGKYRVDGGFPLNPRGRTGVQNRGNLPRWGPNPCLVPIIARYATENGTIVVGKSKRPILEFLAVWHDGLWELPFVLIQQDENVDRALRRLGSELLFAGDKSDQATHALLQGSDRTTLYRGVSEDPINTDNAWLEIQAVSFLDTASVFETLPINQENRLNWIRAEDGFLLVSQHRSFVQLACLNVHAHEPSPSFPKRMLATIFRPGPTASFGFSIGTSDVGQHIVNKVEPAGPAAAELRINDVIVSCNGTVLYGKPHAQVIDLIKNSSSLKIDLQRHDAHGSVTQENSATHRLGPGIAYVGVHIVRESIHSSFGFGLGTTASGTTLISSISPHGLSEELLFVGDEPVSVNGTLVHGLEHDDIVKLCCSHLNLDMVVVRALNAKGDVYYDGGPAVSRRASSTFVPRSHVNATPYVPSVDSNSTDPFRKRKSSIGKIETEGQFSQKHIMLSRPNTLTGFGFMVGTSTSKQHIVTKVTPGGVADKKLSVGDVLVAVDDKDADKISHADLVSVLQSSTTLNLTVSRSNDPKMHTIVKQTSAGALEFVYETEQGQNEKTSSSSPEPKPGVRFADDIPQGAHRQIKRDLTKGHKKVASDSDAVHDGEFLVVLNRTSEGFGISVTGADDGEEPCGVFLSAVDPTLVQSEPRLKVGLQIMRVRRELNPEFSEFDDLILSEAAAILRNSGLKATFVFKDDPVAYQRFMAAPPSRPVRRNTRLASIKNFFKRGGSKAKVGSSKKIGVAPTNSVSPVSSSTVINGDGKEVMELEDAV